MTCLFLRHLRPWTCFARSLLFPFGAPRFPASACKLSPRFHRKGKLPWDGGGIKTRPQDLHSFNLEASFKTWSDGAPITGHDPIPLISAPQHINPLHHHPPLLSFRHPSDHHHHHQDPSPSSVPPHPNYTPSPSQPPSS